MHLLLGRDDERARLGRMIEAAREGRRPLRPRPDRGPVAPRDPDEVPARIDELARQADRPLAAVLAT
jgi:hypothetical protein